MTQLARIPGKPRTLVSVRLLPELVKALDAMTDHRTTRNNVIEQAVEEFLERRGKLPKSDKPPKR